MKFRTNVKYDGCGGIIRVTELQKLIVIEDEGK